MSSPYKGFRIIRDHGTPAMCCTPHVLGFRGNAPGPAHAHTSTCNNDTQENTNNNTAN